MKTSKTIYQFVLDQSGSMSNARPQTVDLFNSQLKTMFSCSATWATIKTGLVP
jgi:hypothetical protein